MLLKWVSLSISELAHLKMLKNAKNKCIVFPQRLQPSQDVFEKSLDTQNQLEDRQPSIAFPGKSVCNFGNLCITYCPTNLCQQPSNHLGNVNLGEGMVGW
jgi:hypothetical protein